MTDILSEIAAYKRIDVAFCVMHRHWPHSLRGHCAQTGSLNHGRSPHPHRSGAVPLRSDYHISHA